MFNNKLENRLEDKFEIIDRDIGYLSKQLEYIKTLINGPNGFTPTPDMHYKIAYLPQVQEINREIIKALGENKNYVVLHNEPSEEIQKYFEEKGYNFRCRTVKTNNMIGNHLSGYQIESKYLPVLEW